MTPFENYCVAFGFFNLICWSIQNIISFLQMQKAANDMRAAHDDKLVAEDVEHIGRVGRRVRQPSLGVMKRNTSPTHSPSLFEEHREMNDIELEKDL